MCHRLEQMFVESQGKRKPEVSRDSLFPVFLSPENEFPETGVETVSGEIDPSKVLRFRSISAWEKMDNR